MALIGNRSVLNKSPGRFINAGVATLRSEFNKHGMQRNAYQVFDAKSATPNGHLAPSAWVLPKTPGGMSSINAAKLTVSPAGLAVGGITTTGESSLTMVASNSEILPLDDSSPLRTASASILFSVADAVGQLISSGSGSVSFSISPNSPLLTASIGGTGEASFAIVSAAAISAEANVSGEAFIQFSAPAATIFPLNDDPVLRDGTATITFVGNLAPYAVGQMIGSTVDNSTLTSDAIAAAVWQALSAQNNTAGTMGNKLNTASSGGVDVDALVEAIIAHAQTLTVPKFLGLK